MNRYEVPVFFDTESDIAALLIMSDIQKLVKKMSANTATEYLVLRHGPAESRYGTVINKEEQTVKER
jgi:hypothetical protein